MGGWKREGDALARQFEFANFVGSVDFVNRVTPIAEEMNHHPDLSTRGTRCRCRSPRTREGGITENDFKLATKIDSVA